MAAVQYRNGSYRVVFRYQAQQHAFTIGQVSEDEAADQSRARSITCSCG